MKNCLLLSAPSQQGQDIFEGFGIDIDASGTTFARVLKQFDAYTLRPIISPTRS